MLSRGSTQGQQYFQLKSGKLSTLHFQWETPGNAITILMALKYSAVEKTLTITFLNISEHKMPF